MSAPLNFIWQKLTRIPRGSALLIMLAVVTLVTVLVVSLLLITRYERTAASLQLGRTQAALLADYGADVVVSRLREAIGNGMSPGRMWISEPGRIRTYDRRDLTAYLDYDLFSSPPGADNSALTDEANVDLNRRSFAGVYPIAAPASGQSAATMKVGWKNILKDPSLPASAANPIVGRIAYWVDDESCKVNVNTADGSKKEDLYRTIGANETAKSYGFGTPSEISFEALADSSGTALTNTQAAAIADSAWSRGINSVDDLAIVSGLSADFLRNNRFNLTHYNSIPEVTFFGEPRIYLFPVARLADGRVRNAATGGAGNYCSQLIGGTDADVSLVSGIVDFVYPISNPNAATPNQFPYAISQYSTALTMGSNNGATASTTNLSYLQRVAHAIAGTDSNNQTIQWPAFGGVTSGFSSKYSPRQIDSLTLQIYDLSNTTVFADQFRSFSLPAIAVNGIINTDARKSRIVSGISRYVKFNEIYLQATVSSGTIGAYSVSRLQMRTDIEFAFPAYYMGAPFHPPYTQGAVTQFSTNNNSGGSTMSGLNQLDKQGVLDGTVAGSTSAASWLGGWWQDQFLQILDQTGSHAGFDLMGNGLIDDDPDQAKAALYHPYRLVGTTYKGGVDIGNRRLVPMFEVGAPAQGYVSSPGVYNSVPNRYKSTQFSPGKPGISELRFRGGVNLWNRTGTAPGGWNQWEPVPLDGLRGPFTSESAATILGSDAMGAVIPVDFTVALSGVNGAGQEFYLARVSDPLVNKFPRDWEGVVGGTPTMVLNSDGNANTWNYMKGGGAALDPSFSVPTDTLTLNNANKAAYLRPTNGDNPGYQPVGGGDPLSVWLPRMDIRYPKQSRFPSVGALNYLRTGMIPDDLSVTVNQQRGVPWRSLNFSSGTAASQTVHGVQYPDWAMLDLFTVPFLPQKPYAVGTFTNPVMPSGLTTTSTTARKLTGGGATQGKMNINNPLIPHPFEQSFAGVSQTPPERTAPLDALFYGIKTSGGAAANAYVDTTASDAKLTKVDHVALRTAVQTYLSAGNRFILPGQLADVTQVNSLTYSGVAANARSRNDLVRQVVGATTTQSNVFSIWMVAQSIKKNPRNANPGIYEAGDTITGEVRRHYLVERLIEVGRDAIPGNALNPGIDGITGTADDPLDSNYHPPLTFPLPYRWRVVAVEDVPA